MPLARLGAPSPQNGVDAPCVYRVSFLPQVATDASRPERMRTMNTRIRHCMVSLLSLTAAASAVEVRVVRMPDNTLVPEVAMTTNGVLYVVYGSNHNAYCVQSTNNGATFSAPVKVNSSGTVETEMGERGPKIALGASNTVHAVWADDWELAAGHIVLARYSRSLDGGKTFDPLKTLSATNGTDGLTVTADTNGNVLAFWHCMYDKPKSNGVNAATWMYVARSTDNGLTFRGNESVRISNLSELACSMCMMSARVKEDGNAYLAFRAAQDNIRDNYVLKGPAGTNAFTAIRAQFDNNYLTNCPMTGPEVTFEPGGRALCAFMVSNLPMTSNSVYWAVSDTQVTGFALHVSTPAKAATERYATALANARGDVLFLWQNGPMSITGTARVKWALYDMSGAFSGRQDDIGQTVSGTKATAFVGTDDNFYIVTTANPDVDNDGLPDAWELQYFGGTNAVNGGATNDWDGDGFSNRSEYWAGTNPTNALSRLALSNIVSEAGAGMAVKWYSVAGKSYAVTTSATPLLAFAGLLQTNIPATPPVNTYTDGVPRPGAIFYRVNVETNR